MHTLLKIGVSAGILFAIIILSQAYEIPLFKKSLDVIPEIQAGASGSTKQFWKIYSDGGLHSAEVLPWLLTYLFIKERSRSFYYLFMSIGIATMSSIVKLHNHQGRPFWENPAVDAIACSNQYGNPSGHSFASMGMALAVWLDFNSVFSRKTESYLSAWYWRLLLLIAALAFAGAIGYSRVFLGVHSINQVYYGL